VGVVIRAFHDAAAASLDGLRGGVDIGGLDPDDDLSGDGMVDRGRQRQGDRPAVKGGEVAPSRNFSDMPRVSL
jgi:hypothetical protein